MARTREPAKRVAEGVLRRGDRYIAVVYYPPTVEGGKGTRKWHTLPAGTNLTQAKKARADLEAAKHEQRSAQEETVGEWADRWESQFPGRKESTVRHNRERINALVRDFRDRPLTSITGKEARLWAVGGVAPVDLYETARNWHGAEEKNGVLTVPGHSSNVAGVRVFFGDAVRAGVIVANPFANLRLKGTGGRNRIQVLTVDELNRLAATARRVHGEYGEHLADLILTAAWTGLRPGELFALTPERVDLEQGTLEVLEAADSKSRRVWSTKTVDGERVVPVLPEAEKALRRVLEMRDPGEFLFQPPRPRHRYRREGYAAMGAMSFGYWWGGVRDAFTDGLPADHWLRRRVAEKGTNGKLVLYEGRHVAATRLAENGVPAEDIAAFLGHRDGGVLAMKTYIHVSREVSHDRIRKAFAA